MKQNKTSRTAQYMALFRALESTRPTGERIFYDPYAIKFLDSKLKAATAISNVSFFRTLIENRIRKLIPGALSSGIARTKYIDELLERTIVNGVKQVVILGAGFDTRALRLGFLKSIPVIEIDHPNTSNFKLNKLEKEFSGVSKSIRYLQIDFNRESLDEFVKKNRINFSLPTTVIWEGVSNYLSAEAIHNTFRFVSGFSKGSYCIFTYVDKKVLDDPKTFFGAEKLLDDLKKIDEHWTFGFDPANISNYLRPFQLTLLEDSGAAEYREKYLPGRTERGYEFYRVALVSK